MDPDHLDIYGTEGALQEAFIDFSKKLKPGGLLLNKFGLKRGSALKAANHLTYSRQNESADVHALNLKMENGSYRFDVMIRGVLIRDIVLNMGGMHNVENAIAAIAVANELEIDTDKIRAAVAGFKGVKRRFEYVVKTDRLVFIDDYAHHPEELTALINGAKTLFKGKRCTVIFQPHLFSRTKDLAAGFAKSLDLADNVILLPVYPARELPMPGVSSQLIADNMQLQHKKILTKEELPDYMKNVYAPQMNKEFGELLIMAGAGDIDTLVEPIRKIVWV
jgi:UDP-N-acetylmuramate--alanine ligase